MKLLIGAAVVMMLGVFMPAMASGHSRHGADWPPFLGLGHHWWETTTTDPSVVPSTTVPDPTTTNATTTLPPRTTPTTAPPSTVPPKTAPPTTKPSPPPTTAPGRPPVTPACDYRSAPGAVPAFCETFSAPAVASGTRSGGLNGTLWGVSRATSLVNLGQGQIYDWAAVTRNTCGVAQTLIPESDVSTCNGQMVEATNDTGAQTILAAYPRQPFDFAGRTGTVAFDVSDNTQGPHGAWPALVITDQPVPAPYDTTLAGVADSARNSVGISFAEACSSPGVCGMVNNPACVGVDSIFMTASYRASDVNFNQDGCVKPATGPGDDNHVEIQISQAGVKIFMADAGNPASLRLVADAAFGVPLTRGLIWLEDVHYNADKFNTQQTNTMTWDNVSFDGPVLPRDLGFDVLDNLDPQGPAENGQPTYNIGYAVPSGGGHLNLAVNGVRNTAGAAAALLELTYWPYSQQTLYYSVNGGPAHAMAWPFGDVATYKSETIAMPVPLAEVHDGTNTISIWSSDSTGVATANYDLILAGAGGVVQP